MGALAVGVFALDQLTKQAVLRTLHGREKIVLDGFFKFVDWHNSGAAWSSFTGNNELLAIVSLVAFLGLFIWRDHFDTRSKWGQVSLGLMFGGILGNLADRLFMGHVVDFLRFYLHTRSGGEAGFPAFNIADSAICVGVGLLFILSWKQGPNGKASAESTGNSPSADSVS